MVPVSVSNDFIFEDDFRITWGKSTKHTYAVCPREIQFLNIEYSFVAASDQSELHLMTCIAK